MTDYTNINWDPFFSAYENDTVVKAIVGEVSGNGHQVFVMGVPAFLPKTQKVPDMELTTGGDVDVCIIKIMPETNNVVVSARVAAEKKAGDGAEKLEVGQVVTARIKAIAQFGAFASVNGVDGLIHITELSYNQIRHPSDVISVGDEIPVKVLSISVDDKGKRKIELSHKQALPDPWETLPFKEGDKVEGVVTNIEDYGAFLSIGEVNALLHRSEITWETEYPLVRNLLAVGDRLTVKIKSMDVKNKRVSVSLREISGEVWDQSDLSVGDVIEVGVLRHSPSGSGLIVGEPNGIQGVLNRKEMAWSKDEAKAYEASVKDGDTIQVAIISFDKEKRKMSVSRKPLLESPADAFIREHPVGSVFVGDVVKNTPPGIIKISIPIGEFRIAFDPSSIEHWYDIMRQYPIGGKLPVLIQDYEPDTKKITFVPNPD
ncbi:MAG: S1 RNA-binding domain-containing protein [Candidatus Methanomethylophilaceae archaeon]|nr:S1 RNA-binding domain-containing protein [Candidatus Methanomethylophilaceae archaeon]